MGYREYDKHHKSIKLERNFSRNVESVVLKVAIDTLVDIEGVAVLKFGLLDKISSSI